MTLGSIIERMADNVKLKVIMGDCDNFRLSRVYEIPKDFSNVFEYLNCEVTMINTSEDGTLMVNVDDDPNEY